MGDNRRFKVFADLIIKHLNPNMRIGDIASGKGKLKAELYRHGFKNVVAWDKRHRNAKRRNGQKYGLFNYKTNERFNALVAMHPDEATDHVIMYGIKNRIPVIVCPCCSKPSATKYDGKRKGWIDHLKRVLRKGKMKCSEVILPITGDNLVLVCKPEK